MHHHTVEYVGIPFRLAHRNSGSYLLEIMVFYELFLKLIIVNSFGGHIAIECIRHLKKPLAGKMQAKLNMELISRVGPIWGLRGSAGQIEGRV